MRARCIYCGAVVDTDEYRRDYASPFESATTSNYDMLRELMRGMERRKCDSRTFGTHKMEQI